ncbi:MAG: YkgJ family cysteine cluster protein [Desulfotomaculales bacterium]
MLPPETLYRVLDYAQPLFQRLEGLYGALPGVTCARCGECCSDAPPAFLIEYLYAYQHIKSHLRPRWPDILTRVTEYFFLEHAEADLRCPFLDGTNTCLIYPARPFACRAWGLAPPERLPIRRRPPAAMQELADYYRERYGLVIPAAVLRGPGPACPHARPAGPIKEPARIVDQAFTALSLLETELVPLTSTLNQETVLPLPLHLALTVLPQGALARRMRAMREYLEEGRKTTLERYVTRARKYAF